MSNENSPRLFTDEDGIWRQNHPEQGLGIRWDEIFRIVGYRLDCMTTVDTVLELEFEFGEFLELNSTFEGFSNVTKALEDRFSDLEPGWLENIEGLHPEDEPWVAWQRPPNQLKSQTRRNTHADH